VVGPVAGNELSGRVAWVTGCGKPDGLGAAIARALGARGATLVVHDISEDGAANIGQSVRADESLSGLVSELRKTGVEVSTVLGDVADREAVMRMVSRIIDRHGHIDVLVNNAGAPHGAEFNLIDAVPDEAFDRVMAVNLRGPWLTMGAVIPSMRRRQWGRIVNIASIAGRMGRRGNAVYSASKAGLISLTRSVALDVADDGITVNAISPGRILTSRERSDIQRNGADSFDAELSRRSQLVPLGRLGRPDEIAAVATFLATSATFVTAQNVVVDGGENPY
jgi:3-oxoacyl-[acyl-carrier protein] reductase